MNGRTFQFDSSLKDAFKYVPKLAGDDLRRAAAAADSPFRNLEEFIRRYVVTADNDNGDITFDVAGTYTFQGDVVTEGTLTTGGDVTVNGDMDVGGAITLVTGGSFRTDASGLRTEMGTGSFTQDSLDWTGFQLYTGLGTAVEPGYIGVTDSSGSVLRIQAPKDTTLTSVNDFPASLTLTTSSNEPKVDLIANEVEFRPIGSDEMRFVVEYARARFLATASSPTDRTTGDGDVHVGRNLYVENDAYLTGDFIYFNNTTQDYIRITGSGTEGVFDDGEGQFVAEVGDEIVFRAGQGLANSFTDNVYTMWGWSENNDGFGYDGTDEVGFFTQTTTDADADFYFGSVGNVTTANSGTDLVPGYGTLLMNPSVATGGYGGINIDGEFVLMGNGTNYGLYDDRNNQWLYVTTSPNSSTLDNNTAALTLEADAADTDLDYQLFYFTPDSDSGGGALGSAIVQFNDEMGGSTGTTAILTTVTNSGITGKRLRFSTSNEEVKSDIQPWGLSNAAFMKIQTSSFIYDDMYVDDIGRHHNWDGLTALDNEPMYDPPPSSWVPLRRAGFTWQNLMSDDELMMLATDLGTHEDAIMAATIEKVQMIMTHLGLDN